MQWWKAFLWIAVFSVALLMHLELERRGVADSIGLWYTIHSATISTFIIWGVYRLLRFIWRLGRPLGECKDLPGKDKDRA